MDRIQYYGNTEPHSGCQFKLIILNAHKILALVFSSWQGTHSTNIIAVAIKYIVGVMCIAIYIAGV